MLHRSFFPRAPGSARPGNGTTRVLIDARTTGGRLVLLEYAAGPGEELPPHLFEHASSYYWVLEGRTALHRREGVDVLGANDGSFLPAGLPHAFQIQSPRVRMRVVLEAKGSRPLDVPALIAHPPDTPLPPAAAPALPTRDLVRASSGHGLRLLPRDQVARELPLYAGNACLADLAVGPRRRRRAPFVRLWPDWRSA